MNPEMRASDSDRDRAVDVLRAALADGRLTGEEFEQRVEAALSSRTFGELSALTADLVPGPTRAGQISGPGRIGEASGPERIGEVIRINQRGGSVRRTGRWVVPRRLDLRPSWCDVTLDFTDAVIRHDTLIIDMKMRGGSLALVVGPGMVVDADSLTAHFTDIEIDAGTGVDSGTGGGVDVDSGSVGVGVGVGEPGAPVILRVRLVGRMRYGWIGTRRAQAGSNELLHASGVSKRLCSLWRWCRR